MKRLKRIANWNHAFIETRLASYNFSIFMDQKKCIE